MTDVFTVCTLLVTLAVAIRIVVTAGVGCWRPGARASSWGFARHPTGVRLRSQREPTFWERLPNCWACPQRCLACPRRRTAGVVVAGVVVAGVRPAMGRLLAYWVSGFVVYMAIHIVLSTMFNLHVLFGVWTPSAVR